MFQYSSEESSRAKKLRSGADSSVCYIYPFFVCVFLFYIYLLFVCVRFWLVALLELVLDALKMAPRLVQDGPKGA